MAKAKPPLPPGDDSTMEDAPPAPSQVPGSGNPTMPTQGDVMTGQPKGVTFAGLSPNPADAQDPRSRALANNPLTEAEGDQLPPVATLPPGVIPVDQFIAGRTGKTTSLGQGYRNFAGVVADGAGRIASGAERLVGLLPQGAASPIDPLNAIGPMIRGAARAAVPPTPTEMGRNIGLGATAALTGGLGAIPAGLAVAGGGILGGAAGGAVDTGTAQGGLQGGLQSVVPSILAGVTTGVTTKINELGGLRSAWDYARGVGAKQAAQQQTAADGQRLVSSLKSIPKLQYSPQPGAPPQPVFGSAKTVEDLRALAFDPVPGGELSQGQAILGNVMDTVDSQIKGVLGDAASTPRFLNPLHGVDGVPSEVSAPTYLPWDDARANLTRLGRMKAGDKTGELAQAYQESIRALQGKLSVLDPSGKAVGAFNQGQAVYEAGTATLNLLRKVLKVNKDTGSTELDTGQLFKSLSTAAAGRKGIAARLGYDGYQILSQVRPGWQPGTADVLAPQGGTIPLAGQIGQSVPGVSGAMQFGRGLTPPRFAGNVGPLPIGPAARAGLAVGPAAASGLITPELQGLPLPGRSQ